MTRAIVDVLSYMVWALLMGQDGEEHTTAARRAAERRKCRMAGQPIASQWHRRMFLKGTGLGMLAASGLTALQPLGPESWAAGERTRFVSTWNAPDIR
jgi:hypothetical protein